MKKREVSVIAPTIDKRIIGNLQKEIRVASYSRVSTSFEEQLNSFYLQKSYYTDLILRTKGWVLAGTYADEGISGVTDSKRPEFLKMMKHCKQGKIDLIITKSLSRFSRNLEVTIKRVRELKALGVAVYFEKENINTMEETSELLISIIATIAQEESNSLSLNVKKGKRMAMQNGVVYWNYYNYFAFRKGEDGNPEIIPEKAKVVREVYEMYLNGYSDAKIADSLNERKIYTKHNSKWTNATVKSLLIQERNCGDVILQKTFIENHITKKSKKNNGELPKVYIKNNHPAIISKEIFDLATLERARRSKKKEHRPDLSVGVQKYSSKYALSERLICNECYSVYRRFVWERKQKSPIDGQIESVKMPIWKCKKRVTYGTKYCQDSVAIDEENLHIAIMKAIAKIENNVDLKGISQKVIEEVGISLYKRKKDNFDIEKTQLRIETIKNEIMKIIQSNDLSENLDKMKSLNEEAVNLQNLVNEYIKQNNNKLIGEKITQMEVLLNNTELECREYNDELVRQIIDKIKVVNENTIIVIFKNGAEIEQVMDNKIKPRRLG